MSGRMSDADIYTLSPTCSFEQEGEGVVVFDAGGGTYWRGNATARRVLELTVHGCTRGDAVERLEREYGHSPGMRDDVRDLLAVLVRARIAKRNA
ncbi:PqqD family protein [Pseudoclavibacter helvolus]|uniref:PqqD family protein n=1 Tax=Pseudoclavibacter helvolus TaxID=255205 RepID=UPI000A8F5DA4|nr:PqqD family protein [Pseudoclavibacter helvolus]